MAQEPQLRSESHGGLASDTCPFLLPLLSPMDPAALIQEDGSCLMAIGLAAHTLPNTIRDLHDL